MILIGTQDSGLVRLDPRTERFEVIYPLNRERKSVSNYNATCIVSDADHNLWAGSLDGGLMYYESTTDKWTYEQIYASPDEKQKVRIRDLQCLGGFLWIATQNHGLLKYLPGVGVVELNHDVANEPDFNYPKSLIVLEKADSTHLWLGTAVDYLFKYNIITGYLQHIVHPAREYGHSFYAITNLLMQGNDSLWIATMGGGLHLLNIKTNTSTLFSCQEFDGSINYNSLVSVYLDNQQVLWVGTNGKGVNYWFPGTSKFNIFSSAKSAQYNLDFQSVRAIFENNNEVFIGGYNGIDRINLSTGHCEYLIHGVPVYAFCYDDLHQQLLIGCEGSAFCVYDLNTGKITENNLWYETVKGEKQIMKFIYEITHYKDDLYLIGTNAGLCILNSSTLQIEDFYFIHPDSPGSFGWGEVKAILIDHQNRIWVGTSGLGFALFNPETGKFHSYLAGVDNKGLLSNQVLSFHDGGDDVLWIGTDRGLNRFNIADKSFDSFTTANGLPNDYVYGILEDESGLLWLSTNLGLCSLNPESGNIKVFSTHDGLLNNEFNTGAFYQAESGMMYFGGVEGVVSFLPSMVSMALPQLVPTISKVFAYNTELKLDTIIPYKKRLVIEPENAFLTFKISGLNYLYPEDNYYQYQIAELTDGWIDNGRNNSISLVDVKHGNYNFRIKVSTDNLNWIEMKPPLKLIIQPHFYETNFFRLSMLILFLAAVFVIFQIRVHFLKRQEKRLQAMVDTKTAALSRANDKLTDENIIRRETEDKLQVANTTKDKFFSIIAHDLRSPFNALLGFSDLLLTEWDGFDDLQKKDMILNIARSSKNTYNLLNNLLDWARIQKGTMKPNIQKIDIQELCPHILDEVKASAEIKSITIEMIPNGNPTVLADEFMLQTIFRNLISNAIKFTRQGGKIRFLVSKNEKYNICSIQDTGIGMDENTLKKLFSIENAGSTKGTNGENGTGLGLIISHEFINLMQGKIWAESTVGEGSTFYVQLPKAK